jgi:hypothetical protein
MKKELTLFDNPRNVRLLRAVFYLALAVVVAAEFFIDKHPEFGVDHFTGFYAVYGFISYVLLIVVAKGIRKFVMRKEDYYD